MLDFFQFTMGSFASLFPVADPLGAVIFEAGWQALKEGSQLTPENKTVAIAEVKEHENIAFIPMTIPLLAGPGSIAVTLGLAAQAGQDWSVETGLNYGAAIVAIAFLKQSEAIS